MMAKPILNVQREIQKSHGAAEELNHRHPGKRKPS
jgi:hypothetical protein